MGAITCPTCFSPDLDNRQPVRHHDGDGGPDRVATQGEATRKYPTGEKQTSSSMPPSFVSGVPNRLKE